MLCLLVNYIQNEKHTLNVKDRHMPETIPLTTVSPEGYLDLLSQMEARRLLEASLGDVQSLFRSCSLAVLNCGETIDDSKIVHELYSDFDIHVRRENGGIELELHNAPANAFVDGKLIKGIKEHLFSVLRDIVYVEDEIIRNPNISVDTPQGITNAVFYILRNARVFRRDNKNGLIVCWGGHSIPRHEYDYTKEVGHQLGLRGMDICTGCGPGAMKGPMKGATIGHAKQRIYDGQYLGITEPGIVAAESPNPIVNGLVIMPDIEKRLEAFVRSGHAIIVFPGGVGTAEEILYLIGALLNPANDHVPYPFVLTGPAESADYFEQIDEFVGITLGKQAQQKYTIIIDDPVAVARHIEKGVEQVCTFRKDNGETFFYNWSLAIDRKLQIPFEPTHEKMRELQLEKNRPAHELAADLRKAFSGIVSGNVKKEGILAIEEKGLFELQGDREIMQPLDELLRAFVQQQRMKIPSDKEYIPCYHLVKK